MSIRGMNKSAGTVKTTREKRHREDEAEKGAIYNLFDHFDSHLWRCQYTWPNSYFDPCEWIKPIFLLFFFLIWNLIRFYFKYQVVVYFTYSHRFVHVVISKANRWMLNETNASRCHCCATMQFPRCLHKICATLKRNCNQQNTFDCRLSVQCLLSFCGICVCVCVLDMCIAHFQRIIYWPRNGQQ